MERTLPPLTGVAPRPEATAARAPRLSQLALAVALAVALWDFLFFEQVVGFTRGVFTLAATALLLFAHPRALRCPLVRWLVVGLVAVAASQCLEPTTLAACLSWVGLASLGLAARTPDGLRGIEWPLAWLGLASRGWLSFLPDLSRLRGRLAARSGWRGSVGRWLSHWLLPTLLSLPFLVLFAMANPVIEVGFDDLFETLGEFLADLSLHRLLVWAVVAAGLWALLRFRAPERAQLPAAGAIAASREALRDAMLVRCLIVFNALFAVQTALDAGYFWSGFALPDGMSYAGYAHRGAYPLVATTLLAIVFILTAFHDGREVEDDRQHRLAARLVYVWLAQNAFLLTSAAARLGVYVEAYQLTYFRIGAAIWMLLVGLGLAWTAVKLATGRSHAWLVDVNLATAAVILVLCCFPNYDRWIADYNVDQAISQDRRLDQHYLARLGPEALPALRRWWVAESWRVEYPDQADCVNRRLLRRVEEQEASWRGQTLRRRALHQRLDRSWGAHLPGRTSRSC